MNSILEDDIDEGATSSKRFRQAVSSSEENQSSDHPNSSEGASSEDYVHTETQNRTPLSLDTHNKHSPIPEEAIDVEFGEHRDAMTEGEKKILRKRNNKMICAGMSSTISDEEVEWVMKYFERDIS